MKIWQDVLEIIGYRKRGLIEQTEMMGAAQAVLPDIELPDFVDMLGTVAQNQYRTMECTGFTGAHGVSIMKTMKDHFFHTVEGHDVWNLQIENGTADPRRGDFIESAPIAMKKSGLIKDYKSIKRSDFKKALANGHPILTGARVGAPMCDRNYIFKTGGTRGGHAFLIIGYNDSEECFIALNSWGENWGYKRSGRFKIRYTDVGRLYTPYILEII